MHFKILFTVFAVASMVAAFPTTLVPGNFDPDLRELRPPLERKEPEWNRKKDSIGHLLNADARTTYENFT
jgi:hypothetical protein